METVTGTVTDARTLWWLKINTKPVRFGGMDGARFPSVIRVRYAVGGQEYTKRTFVSAALRCPQKGESVTVQYRPDRPEKSKIAL